MLKGAILYMRLLFQKDWEKFHNDCAEKYSS